MNDSLLYILVLLVFMIYCISFRLFVFKKNKDIFDPYYLVIIIYIMVMVVAPLIWIAKGMDSKGGYYVLDGLPRATFIFGCGFFCFFIGDILGKKKANIRAERPVRQIYFDKKTITLIAQSGMVLTTLIYVYTLSKSGKSILSQFTLGIIGINADSISTDTIIGILSGVRLAYIPFLTILIYYNRKNFLVYIELILVTVLYISTGYRYILLLLIFSPIIAIYIAEEKRPKSGKLLKYGLIIFLVVSLIGVTRDAIRSGMAISSFTVWDLFDTIMPNIEVFYPYYKTVVVVPNEVPYAYGTSFLYIIFQFIPRTIWPGKPEVPFPQLRDHMFGTFGQNARMEYIHVGEFYLNFGIIGVMLGMFLFGYLIQRFYVVVKQRNNPLSIIAYSMIFVYLLQYCTRGNFANVSLQLLYLFGPLIIVQLIAGTHRYKLVFKH